MVVNRDPLNVAFVGKHKGIDTDIYKFEASTDLPLSSEVTWDIGSDSTSPLTATQRYLNIGGDANKLMIRIKDKQCAISEINGVTLPVPITLFVGASFTNKFGKPISSFKLMFETDNIIVEVLAIN